MGRVHVGGKESDEELLAAWREGDARAAEELWRRHARSVQRFFRNKVPWSAALDLSQRTAEACLRSRCEIRCFRKYVLGTAVLVLKDHLRAEARKQRRQPDLETLTIEQTVDSAEVWMGAKREKRTLLRALRRLPLPLQVVLELHYWEELSARDIVEVVGWPEGTVKTRIASGTRKLRAEMARLAESPDELRSTTDSLDRWVGRTRDHVFEQRRVRDQAPGGTSLAQGSGSIRLPLDTVEALNAELAAGTLDGVPVEILEEEPEAAPENGQLRGGEEKLEPAPAAPLR